MNNNVKDIIEIERDEEKQKIKKNIAKQFSALCDSILDEFSVNDICNELNISSKVYYAYRNAETNIPHFMLCKIATFFGVNLDYLFDFQLSQEEDTLGVKSLTNLVLQCPFEKRVFLEQIIETALGSWDISPNT